MDDYSHEIEERAQDRGRVDASPDHSHLHRERQAAEQG
jgi:hypothetical protein